VREEHTKTEDEQPQVDGGDAMETEDNDNKKTKKKLNKTKKPKVDPDNVLVEEPPKSEPRPQKVDHQL